MNVLKWERLKSGAQVAELHDCGEFRLYLVSADGDLRDFSDDGGMPVHNYGSVRASKQMAENDARRRQAYGLVTDHLIDAVPERLWAKAEKLMDIEPGWDAISQMFRRMGYPMPDAMVDRFRDLEEGQVLLDELPATSTNLIQ